jgi:cystathionine beta-lyase
MKYDFDRETSRQDTCAVKWEFIQRGENLLAWEHTGECFGPNRILPMWVADMDLRCPEPVVKAVVARAEHGIYGYTDKTDRYYQSVVGWMERRHGWQVDPEWICTTPGVVPALNMLVRTFVAPGESVIVQRPVYYPFFSAIENNGGQVVSNSLVLKNGRYQMDFEDLAIKAQNPKVKMAILCSPHNPVGRVWTQEELARFAEICLRNDILMVSDEIHSDLIYKSYTFTPFGSLGEEIAQNAVLCTAPSKTFNLAGLQTSNIIIPNAELRTRFEKTIEADGLFGINPFGLVAAKAAYNHGEEWLEHLLDYVEGNLRYLQQYVGENIPQIDVIPPEGTYLVWLDCRRLGLDKWGLKRLMLEEARVYLDDGFIFGPEGEGFQRVNIACPRSIVVEALERIREAIKRLG